MVREQVNGEAQLWKSEAILEMTACTFILLEQLEEVSGWQQLPGPRNVASSMCGAASMASMGPGGRAA